MSYQKLNPNRAWTVTPSNFAPLPVYMSEVLTRPAGADFIFGSLIISMTGDFVNNGVRPGDVVVGSTTGASATIINVYFSAPVSNIILNGDPGLDQSEAYTIYRGNNRGALLYVGVGGDVRVLTAGNDDVTFKGVAAGSFLPVNVIQVFETGTTAEDILALY